VNVTIVGRPDPSKDARVVGLVNLQAETARNFWRAQISNFQQRMESRHRPVRSSTPASESLVPKTRTMAMTNDGESPRDSSRLSQINARSARAAQLNDPMSTPASGGGSEVLSSGLVNTIIAALSTSTLDINLASLSSGGKPASETSEEIEIWGAGNLRVGTRNQQGGGEKIDFTTNGVSLGMDRRFGEQLTLGMGIGYARDKSTIGSDGTGSTSDGNSVAAYASYQPGSMFIDGLLGYGVLNMDTTRYVASVNDFARANRSGSQVFASLAAGYEYRNAASLLSPYARYDYAVDRLDEASETGAGSNALNYSDQSNKSQQISLGMRAESQRETQFGWMVPRARVEYQHHIDGASQASIAYADLVNTRYALAVPTVNSNSLLLGVGSGFVLHNRLNLDFDYQWLHSAGQENSQAVFFRLSYGWQ
jgi:uncharacterized protein with beta-barrel porin domain